MKRNDETFRSATVLVVDDEAFMRAFLKRLLGALGIENVLTAENGWKGLKAVAKWGREIDIVILDMHMPVLDGLGFLTRLRSKNSPYPELPVLILTGEHDESVVRDCVDLGVHGFVVKPIDIDTLGARLKAALKRKPLMSKLNA